MRELFSQPKPVPLCYATFSNGMKPRVEKVRINGFRGVPKDLLVDFRSYQGNAASTIISGDNGTGKSSIVDALEFGLQARIDRSQKLMSPSVPLALSLMGTREPRVEVELSDNTRVSREIAQNGNVANLHPHSQFAMAPFVLRRSDILRFWNTPEVRRQLIFWDHFRSSGRQEWANLPMYDLQNLEQERTNAKRKRRDLAKKVAVRMEIDVDDVPLTVWELENFIRDKFYEGLTTKQRKIAERRGMRFYIPKHLDQLLRELRAASESIKKLNREIRRFKKETASTPVEQRKIQVPAVMASISQRLTDSFCKISTSGAFVDRISLSWGDMSEVSLSLKVHLKNGKVSSPVNIFSEANLDLLALIIFLAVAKESADRGQAPLLILDDVFQSVDASIRLNVVEYILKEFSDWQLIFTVHDRLWQEQLRVLMQRHNKVFVEREIVRWDFVNGPVLSSVSRDMDGLLKEALQCGEIYTICAQAGLLLERTCNTLSYNLPISVTRRMGDKYTLGNLWPGIYKVLKKTSISDIADEIERWLHLRNLVGAHFNEWAGALSRQEAQFFGDSVLQLLDHVQCTTCHRWIKESRAKGTNKVWQCQCGSTRVERRPNK